MTLLYKEMRLVAHPTSIVFGKLRDIIDNKVCIRSYITHRIPICCDRILRQTEVNRRNRCDSVSYTHLSMSEKEEAQGVLGEAEDDDSLARKVMEVNMSAMRESYMLLDNHNLLKIVRMIEEARRVFLFGIGDSLLAAEEARNKFLRITGKVSCITDPHIQAKMCIRDS